MPQAVVFALGLLLLGVSSFTAAVTGTAALEGVSIGAAVTFTDEEIRIIRAHYRIHGDDTGFGSGGGKGKRLPPGIAKNLARGKSLPPGIAKQALPRELMASLPPVPDGYERVIVAGKILLVEIATQVIHDILTDVVLH